MTTRVGLQLRMTQANPQLWTFDVLSFWIFKIQNIIQFKFNPNPIKWIEIWIFKIQIQLNGLDFKSINMDLNLE